jgi:hydrogenase nickel incorporation protein HypB
MALKDELSIGVIEADVDSDVDARAIAATGAKTVQLHTGGMCHLNADMVRQGLEAFGGFGLDFVVVENIGNLLCPAAYDLGAAKSVMILSVPEGDDKPLKYPPMFSKVDVLLVNKIDAIEYFNFDFDVLNERVTKLNPKIKIFPISAKTGEGIDNWVDWVRTEIINWREQ